MIQAAQTTAGKIKQVIGWEPQRSLNETLDEIIRYFRGQQASDSPPVLSE